VDIGVKQLKNSVTIPMEPLEISTAVLQVLSWDQVRDQVRTKYDMTWDQVAPLIKQCTEPTSVSELMALYGFTNRTKFRKAYIAPLVASGVLAMIQPDSPTSPTQKYYLTDFGKKLL
jgi:ATP-dependent DNA helicase RecG